MSSKIHIAFGILAAAFVVWSARHFDAQYQARLRDADVRARFILAAQQAGTGIMEVSPNNGVIVYADEIAAGMFGYKSRELPGKNLSILHPEWLKPIHAHLVRQAMDNARRHPEAPRVIVVRCEGVRKDGTRLEFLTRAYLDPESNSMFASVNAAQGVHFQFNAHPSQPQP